jgi:hypothetical protein
VDDIARILRQRIRARAVEARFGDEELRGLPEPVVRYFRAAIAPGTPLATGAQLTMHGRIKLGVWLPFHASETLDPQVGFVWPVRVAVVLRGHDHYLDRAGGMDIRLGRRIRLLRDLSSDAARSAAGRAAAEGIWVPPALLPRFGARWRADADDHLVAEVTIDDRRVALHVIVDDDGHVTRCWFDRWGDPTKSGRPGWHRFETVATGHATFDGVTIPHRGRAGWHDADAHPFIRWEITEHRLLSS